jgi:hypothetical protein
MVVFSCELDGATAHGDDRVLAGGRVREAVMRTISLATADAVGALITVGGFVIGIALMASSGVQVLIPETGNEGREWLADAQDAGDLFVAGASVTVFAGLFALGRVRRLLRRATTRRAVDDHRPGRGVAGMVLVTISHATPIAIALELAPGYLDANPQTGPRWPSPPTRSRGSAC